MTELRARLAEIADLDDVASLLAWDQQTMMPAGGAQARAEQRATLGRITHERLACDDLARLLAELEPYEQGLEAGCDEASLLRVTRRDHERARRVPSDLHTAMALAAASAIPVWVEARARSDFALLRPHLERQLELRRRYVDCFEDFSEPYDVLLADFEDGLDTAAARSALEALRRGLEPLLGELRERAGAVADDCLRGHFPIDGQRRLSKRVLGQLGFDAGSWRLDQTVHPFAANPAEGDVRITTRYDERDLASALFSAIHEFGHGLYDAHIPHAYRRSPLGRIGASMSLHESQSRLWENFVGRSPEFWQWATPVLRDALGPAAPRADAETLYRAVNKVSPSLIRVEADEVTYNLHVILRFELEQELLAGTLAVAELPEAWNARMRSDLGVDVPDDARGVLQDVHWASGAFGYFPTYALGNLVAAQLWKRLHAQLPDIGAQIADGDFAPLRAWLGENLHRHGRRQTLRETLARLTGSSALDPEPYLRYLRTKLGDVYGL